MTYATQRFNASWSTLWTPTKVDGHAACLQRLDAQLADLVPGSPGAEPSRGYEQNQVNTSGTVDITLSNASFLSARGGLFHDRYSDTGISNVTSTPT